MALALVWLTGALASLQAMFVMRPRGAPTPLDVALAVQPQTQTAVLMIVASAIVGGFIMLRVVGRRALLFIFGAIFVSGAVSLAVSHLIGVDILFAPMALAALLAALTVQAWRIAKLDACLSHGLLRDASRASSLEGDAATARLTSGLRLLSTVLPLEDTVVFRLDEENALVPAARLRAEGGAAGQNANKESPGNGANSTWRAGVHLCEQAIKTSRMQTETTKEKDGVTTDISKASNEEANGARASVALPLIHAERIVGALLVRLKEDFDAEDQPLLETVSSQLARDLQRDDARRNVTNRLPAESPMISTRAARRRLEAYNVVSGLLIEQSFAPYVLDAASEGYAIAYLDGTIGYVNSPILRYAQIIKTEREKLDLFDLLDRFRSGVFDEPSLAVRRVLQTGEAYERELFFPDRNQTLALRIALIRERAGDVLKTAGQPLCLAITVRDVSRAKEYEKMRSDMVSLMSHELRTPITSINGFAELLSADETIPTESREFLSIICTESQRLSRMIDTFLSVTKLEQGDRQEVMKSPLLLNEVVKETVANMQPTAKRKRIRLVERNGQRIPPVIADRGLITQVVTNLVDNAIRYSPERTTVTVSAELEAEAVRLTVEDRGYGIPPESVDRVWEKFYRVARDGQEKDEESTGLGLAFVREIVEQHGGTVGLETEVGQGSKFSFTLPRL